METVREIQVRRVMELVQEAEVRTGIRLSAIREELLSPHYKALEHAEWKMLGMAVVEAEERGVQKERAVKSGFHQQLVESLGREG
jgi:hypothetical protein